MTATSNSIGILNLGGGDRLRHLSNAQKERILGILLSIFASLLFAVAENIMSDEDEKEDSI